MFARGLSTFALPMLDSDACDTRNWLCKGIALNPGKKRKEYVEIIRGLFSHVATLHLVDFPRTRRVAECQVVRAIRESRFNAKEFDNVMQIIAEIAPPRMQQNIRDCYTPYIY